MSYRPRKWKTGCLTDVGNVRRTNEDCLYVNEEAGLFLVADGMGGHKAGEVASALAVKLVSSLIEERLESDVDRALLVRAAIRKANGVIFNKSAGNTAWSEMGTTLVLALMADHQMVIAPVGDSRAYSITSKRITQLTEDHTFVADWVRKGLLTKVQARNHHQRHGLTEAVGVTEDVGIEVFVRSRQDDECLLLCSDGLTDMMDDEEILEIVASAKDPQAACDNLVQAANSHGGDDNISVVLVCPRHS
ncbi:MAG: Stp1/IreP family PP2C-type Ser/Thr phosphatase [Desulfomonile tiedjei]|uniref:Stp1/IreP family PP2C-type Ser/Thr phosphatase n=1 Tax=Desulfomonile tiedjei TaxID=2358 RepID=A0A9D6V541_9BACT|nr:Stp1/IreP family PP2C-type Ser/Thr phosphatase [Desulfomonile tiedjei]